MSENRKQWMAMLAKLVCPSDPAGAARALAAYLPLLASLPDGAFTIQSLESVARDVRRTPSYAELRDALETWWRDNKPPALPSNLDDLDATDRSWLAYWGRRRSDGFKPVGGVSGGSAHLASLVRQHSPKAWARIVAGESP